MNEKRKTLSETTDHQGKRGVNIPIGKTVRPQKDMILRKEAPKRIARANLNPETEQKLTSQEIISEGEGQLASKKNSFQQVKRRSTLPKQTNQKIQKRMNHRPKPRSGEKKWTRRK